MLKERIKCLLCQQDNMEGVDVDIKGIAGDNRLWQSVGGEFAVCRDCGHIQKMLTDQYKQEVALIYKDYCMKTLHEGRQILSFNDGGTTPKMEKLIRLLQGEIDFPQKGTLLDFGCNRGHFLKNFGKLFPDWILHGLDSNESKKDEVLSIPGIKRFYVSEDDIQEQYDFIALINVIEHMFEPVASLKKIRNMLKPEGFLLICTPNLADHAFDLPIVEHCSHFYFQTLRNAVNLSGLEIVHSNKWINKEIGLIVKVREVGESRSSGQETIQNMYRQSRECLLSSSTYIQDEIKHARESAKNNTVGILGVAIDGTYIGSHFIDDLDFYVDENPFYVGKKYMGKKIFSIVDIPDNSSVYLPFPYDVACSIQERFKVQYPHVKCILPIKKEDSLVQS